MKKLLLFAVFTVFVFTASQAQNEIKLGANAALPVGDADAGYSFGANATFAYLFSINEVFKVGPSAGFYYYFGKSEDYDTGLGTVTVKNDGAAFLPLGGEARFNLEEFFFGADLGYGIGLAPDGNDGGFYYRPMAGYNFGTIGVVLSYSGFAVDGGTFSSVNAGVEFTF